MFEKCCIKPELLSYSLQHKPKPLKMIPDLRDSIDRFLWYVPGIDSYQSSDNYLIDDPLYSLPIFEEVLLAIGLDLDKDLDLLEDKHIPHDLNDFYENTICTSCQKAILTRYKNETWLRTLLRHVRNSIAHGSFTTIDVLVLFKDKIPKTEKFTSIIKIDAIRFNKALSILDEFDGVLRTSSGGFAEEKIFKRVFNKNGFDVISEPMIGNIRADFIAVKNGIKYAVEIKRGNYKPIGSNDIYISRVEKQLDSYLSEGYKPILIYDRGWLTTKASDHLKNKEFIVLDKKDLVNFFNGDLTKEI